MSVFHEVVEGSCPVCGGPPVPLGTLGLIEWFRCRNCGLDFEGERQTAEGHSQEGN